MIAVAALAVVLLFMLAELSVSVRHERLLRARGAVEPPDAVYSTMRWAYPVVFVVMAVEGLWSGPAPGLVLVSGLVVFAVGKAVKIWAITTLGERWTYKVLVLPGVPLVTGGPYRFVKHPNYVGVIGELTGMALLTGARVSGPLGLVFFSWLLMRRIQAEEQALKAAPR
jgi:methyltransferase